MSQVTIRHLRKEDAESLSRLASNKKIWDNLRDYMPFPYGLVDANNFIEKCTAKKDKTDFAVCYKDEFAGVMGYNPQQDIYRESAEIGYWIGEPFWGKGIASDALPQVVEHAFSRLDVKRLFTSVFEFNVASMRVLEKAGFQREGRALKAIIKNDVFMDEIKFCLLNPKYFPSEK